MKKLFIPLVLLANIAFAQSVNYNKIILPENTPSIEFEEKLVQLAWKNYPENDGIQRGVNIARRKVFLARWSWTDNFRLFYNVNDRTLNKDVQYYQAKYGLGLSINISDFIMNPAKTKIAKEEFGIALDDVNQQKIKIRAEVLKRYHKYQLSVNMLKIRLQGTEDVYSTHVLISDKFKKGEITLQQYNQSLALYSKAMETRMDSETNMLVDKVALEELIGMKLEDVQ